MNIMASLKKDVLDLYLRTGNKDVEDVFVKIAAMGILDFNNWIINKAKIDLAGKNIDPMTLSSLAQLVKLFHVHPDGIQFKDVGPLVFNSDFNNALPFIYSIGKFCFNFRNMNHFSALIASLKKNLTDTSKIPVDDNKTREDLQIINDVFEQKEEGKMRGKIGKEDKEEKATKSKEATIFAKREMYSFLLKRLTQELSQEAERKGNKELSSAIKSGGLASRYEVSRFVKFPDVYNGSMKKAVEKHAKDTLRYVLSNSGEENMEENYNYIKARALDFAFILPRNDYYHPSQSIQRTITDALSESEEESDELKAKSAIHNSSLFFNPSSLSFISMFFELYTQEINKK